MARPDPSTSLNILATGKACFLNARVAAEHAHYGSVRSKVTVLYADLPHAYTYHLRVEGHQLSRFAIHESRISRSCQPSLARDLIRSIVYQEITDLPHGPRKCVFFFVQVFQVSSLRHFVLV